MLQGIDRFGIPVYYTNGPDQPHYENGLYTGIYGQCVEYVRRWYIHMYGLSFVSIPNATDLWELPYTYSIKTQRLVPFRAIANRKGFWPTIGSVLVFTPTTDAPHGHVAVVTNIHRNRIDLAEQNHSAHPWTHPYSRSIPIDHVWRMKDCLGWKSIVF